MDVAAPGKTNKPSDNMWELLAVINHIFVTIQKECYQSSVDIVKEKSNVIERPKLLSVGTS